MRDSRQIVPAWVLIGAVAFAYVTVEDIVSGLLILPLP